MALDLPAFERPATATSGRHPAGNWSVLAALSRKRACGYVDMTGLACGLKPLSLVYNSPPVGTSEDRRTRSRTARELLRMKLWRLWWPPWPASAWPLPHSPTAPRDGATKAAVCSACHGPNGNSSNPEWPNLAGQGERYMVQQLKFFKEGKRNNPRDGADGGDAVGQGHGDLAAYYAAQKPTGLEADPSYWEAGQKLYRGGDSARNLPACIACHGPVGRGNLAGRVPSAARSALRLHTEAAQRLRGRCTPGRQRGDNAHASPDA